MSSTPLGGVRAAGGGFLIIGFYSEDIEFRFPPSVLSHKTLCAGDGDGATIRAHVRETFQLAGYEMLGIIGAGGMSTVWKARQLSLDRIVAIKTLAPEYLPDADAWQRFRLEAKAAARLNHPGIVQVFDAGESGGQPYIVMEFVDGRSLGDILIERGRLPEEQALSIVDAVAQALGYAWDKDCIIHCDVKPDNILISNEGVVKVVDLGLVRFIGLHRRRVGDGDLIVGTPNYTAPEQADGAPDLDCRVDIYSLGATLYHMVTGKLPFAGSPGSSAMDRHQHEFLPDPIEVAPTLQPATAWLIEKMMVKDRAFRPPYWSTVLLDVAEVRRGRLPRDPLPEPGQSTVARSARRVIAPRNADESRANPAFKIAPRAKVAVKSARISGGGSRSNPSLQAINSPSGASARFALFQLLLLIVMAAVVYGFFFLGVAERIRPRPRPTPGAAPSAPTPERAEVQDDNSAVNVDWNVDAPAPSAEPAREAHSGPWRDETFVRGARAFNEAIALYKDYQATRANPAVLSRVETLAREAAKAFESCRDRAPESVGIDEHIRNAYKLIADVRQSTLVDNARPIADDVQREALPAPASSLAPPQTRPPPAAPQLSLSPVWNKMPLGNRAIWEDVRKLFGPHGQPDVQLDAAPNLQLVGQIYYLMPAAEAARALGAAPGIRRPVETPGFPDRSFSYYPLRGDFGEGFDQAALVVDTADRVVAVQLSREKPAPISLDPESFSVDWRVHNIVLGKVKGRRDWRIAHAVRVNEGVVIVDSELAESDPFQVYGLGRSKERVTLYLPQQVVNLILARLENAN